MFLDEADSLCVPPGTEVVTGYPSSPEVKAIEEVDEDGEPIPSVDFETNEIQSDSGRLVDSGVADFFEIELKDGRTVTASREHPFFTVGDDGRLVEKELRELEVGDEIADFRDDVGVSGCETCGDWTAGRFCSVGCKDEGHSREMSGEGNPMYGTEWSDERREKIVEKLSDGRLAGENNPNYGGDYHGVHVWEMGEETVRVAKENLSEMRSDTSWEEWVVDADAEEVKERISKSVSDWWENLDEERKEEIVQKIRENTDYPVCDITGDDNPMRDPDVAEKVSEALMGHKPSGGYPNNVRYEDELGHVVRSDWEYEVAEALQEEGIGYEYEPEFELSESSYYPDFVLDDIVIEVKGNAEMWGRLDKIEEFLEKYGDEYSLVVVGDERVPHSRHFGLEEFEPAVLDGGIREVETAEVTSIEYSHRGKAYNITMEGTPNFMLGNGILTHNTSDAQPALRRTMEMYTNTCRFILSCNYSSNIIDPIQSRCAVFRFSPLDDDAVAERMSYIADEEDVDVTDDGLDALAFVSQGDMRRAVNALQAASSLGETVDEDAVFSTTSTARPEEVETILTTAVEGNFGDARDEMEELIKGRGIGGDDLIDQIHRSVLDLDIDDALKVRLMDRIGEVDYRVSRGADEEIQLQAFLASLALGDEESRGV
ncbi:MAG: replication factor C small subunit [Halobacteria archaeon]|nr:replication factor C small subunit [Halobacteria archaeon]